MSARNLSMDHNFFDIIDTEEKAYFLGIMASDGNVSSDRDCMEISLSGEEDRALLERFKDALKYNGLIKNKSVKYPNAKPCSRLSFTSKQIKNSLIMHGITPRKSLTLEFPVGLSRNLTRHFIRGYFDGDGSVSYKKDGSFLVSLTSSPSFIASVTTIINDILSLSVHIERPIKTKAHNLKIGGNFAAFIFLDWIYKDATVYLSRKQAKYILCSKIVRDKLMNCHEFYNIYSHKESMSRAAKCAGLLGMEFTMANYDGLSVTREEQDAIISFYASGSSMRKTAKQFGCSLNLIKNVLSKNNVSIRPFRKIKPVAQISCIESRPDEEIAARSRLDPTDVDGRQRALPDSIRGPQGNDRPV